jgi:hypothetical protein
LKGHGTSSFGRKEAVWRGEQFRERTIALAKSLAHDYAKRCALADATSFEIALDPNAVKSSSAIRNVASKGRRQNGDGSHGTRGSDQFLPSFYTSQFK